LAKGGQAHISDLGPSKGLLLTIPAKPLLYNLAKAFQKRLLSACTIAFWWLILSQPFTS